QTSRAARSTIVSRTLTLDMSSKSTVRTRLPVVLSTRTGPSALVDVNDRVFTPPLNVRSWLPPGLFSVRDQTPSALKRGDGRLKRATRFRPQPMGEIHDAPPPLGTSSVECVNTPNLSVSTPGPSST